MHANAKKTFRIFCLSIATTFISHPQEAESWAAGKKPPVITSPSCKPLFSTPSPVRPLRLAQIGTKSFQLPNGAQADVNYDMQSILNTAVTGTAAFAPTEPGATDPCNNYLELRSTVSTFQLDVLDAGISFGYSPAGPLSAITSINGNASVKVGMIAMDFSLWQCNNGNCFSAAASTSNHLVFGTNITFNLDFGTIKAGTALIYNPILGSVLRAIMMDGIKKLVASPRLPDLPWTASVQLYNPATGVFLFSAGSESRIFPNQTFVVYEPTDNTPQGVCNVFQPVAYGHTISVDSVNSEAVVDQILTPRGIEVGDVVMIRKYTPPSNSTMALTDKLF